MNFIDLPEEIIRMIIQYLDIKSIQSLYETCEYLRRIIMMHGVVKKCKMSLTTLATARFLKTRFFKDISPFIQDLDMSAVPDLSKTTFLAAVKKLKTLKSLNVSYTSLKLEHLADIGDTCPDLKNVCANFEINTCHSLMKIQNFFEKIENVHFIGSYDMLYSKLVFTALQKAKLNYLKFTVSRHEYTFHTVKSNLKFKVPYFNRFYVYLLDWLDNSTCYANIKELAVLTILDLNLFEFIVISSPSLTCHKVFVSKLFVNFFMKYFDLEPCCVHDFNDINDCLGNIAIMLWRKDVTKFDIYFFNNLFNRLKKCFPYYIDKSELMVPITYDWFVVMPKILEKDEINYEPEVKKNRLGIKKKVLDFDTIFRHKKEIEISFDFSYLIRDAVTLSSNTNYLSKITYLSLSGDIRYSREFFNVLFRCCIILKTLNVDAPSISPCFQSISRSLPLSFSIRNFRLVDRGIDFKAMFTALSQCRAIENIFVRENSDVFPTQFADPSVLFQNCINLYNLHIDFLTSQNSYKTRWRPMFLKAISKYDKPFLNLVLCPRLEQGNAINLNIYDPFIDVFKLNSIRDV